MGGHGLEAFGVADGLAEADFPMFQGVKPIAQAAEHLFHLVAKAQGHAGDQVIGQGTGWRGAAVVQRPAEDVVLAGDFTVERLELLRAWRLGRAQQHALDHSVGVALAQHPEVLQLGFVQRQGRGAQACIAALAQALDQLEILFAEMPLQHGGIGQGVDPVIEHRFNRLAGLGFGLQLFLQSVEVQARLQGRQLLDEPGGRQGLIDVGQGRVVVGEGGLFQEVRVGAFIVRVQAAQGQFDQAALVGIVTDGADEAAGGDLQSVRVQVVNVQLIAQAFQPLVPGQGVRRGQGHEHLLQVVPGLVVVMQVLGQPGAPSGVGAAVPVGRAVSQPAVQQGLGAPLQAWAKVGHGAGDGLVQCADQWLRVVAGIVHQAQGAGDVFAAFGDQRIVEVFEQRVVADRGQRQRPDRVRRQCVISAGEQVHEVLAFARRAEALEQLGVEVGQCVEKLDPA